MMRTTLLLLCSVLYLSCAATQSLTLEEETRQRLAMLVEGGAANLGFSTRAEALAAHLSLDTVIEFYYVREDSLLRADSLIRSGLRYDHKNVFYLWNRRMHPVSDAHGVKCAAVFELVNWKWKLVQIQSDNEIRGYLNAALPMGVTFTRQNVMSVAFFPTAYRTSIMSNYSPSMTFSSPYSFGPDSLKFKSTHDSTLHFFVRRNVDVDTYIRSYAGHLRALNR